MHLVADPPNIASAPTVGEIYDEHADFVWRNLQRMGVRAMDLEDALQEVFVVVHRKLDTFEGSSRLTTWLFGICLRVAAAQRRRAHLRREHSTPEIDHQPDTRLSADPEASAMRREAEIRLAEVLDSLELGRRAVFVMFEIEGLSAGAIAQTLGVPVGTVYSRLSTARNEFSQALARMAVRDGRGAAR